MRRQWIPARLDQYVNHDPPGLYSRPGLYLRPGFYSRKYGMLVSWSLTSLFSTNMATSETKIRYVINDKDYVGFKSVTENRELRKYITR